MVIDAHSGAMGGSQSQEFMVRTPAGEDLVVSCEKCNYAANMEKATSKLAPVEDLKPEGDGQTAAKSTLRDRKRSRMWRGFWAFRRSTVIKTVAYDDTEDGQGKQASRSSRAVVLLMRGDHQMNEAKLLDRGRAGKETRPMQEEEIRELFHAPAGFLGPLGTDWAKEIDTAGFRPSRILLVDDGACKGRTNLIGGANKAGLSPQAPDAGKEFSSYGLRRICAA